MHSLSRAPTSAALLVERVKQLPSRPFVVTLRSDHQIQRYTYLEAGARIAAVAAWLERFGLRKGDRVAAYLDAGDPGIWFYLGCAVAGVVPVPLGPSFSVDALAKLATQCEARAIFTTPELVERVRHLPLPILTIGDVIPDGATAISVAPVADPIAALEARAAAIGPDDLYMFQPTSGSTGAPKLVMRRNATFPYAGRLLAANQPVGEADESALLVAALTHGVGHYDIHRQLQLGGCLCIPPTIDVGVKLADAERLAPVSMAATPRVVRALLLAHDAHYGAHAAATPFLSPRFRRLCVGGAPPDEALLRELERRAVLVSEGYGATEVSLLSVTPFGERRPGSAGKISPEVELRVADDGELLARSPFRMAGYFGDPKLTAEAFDAEGYYQTGDRAAIESDGYLRILGRKRDVFNSAEGANIYPARIETALEGLPGVRQAILVGDALPFIVALLVVDAPASEASAPSAELRAQLAVLNQGLEAFERVRRVACFAQAFPADVYRAVGQGKVARERKKILETYQPLIAQLYSPAGEAFAVPASD